METVGFRLAAEFCAWTGPSLHRDRDHVAGNSAKAIDTRLKLPGETKTLNPRAHVVVEMKRTTIPLYRLTISIT